MSRRLQGAREEPVATTVLVAAVLAVVVALIGYGVGGAGQPAAAALYAIGLVGLVFARPKLAIVATFVFLALLGDLRRIVSMGGGDGSLPVDPILLVGPAVAFVLLVLVYQRGRLRPNTTISKLVFALCVVMILQMANPLQGGVMVGIAGGLFYLVPMAWFWIGKQWGDDPFVIKVMYSVIVPIAVLASLVGLYQNFVGFLPHEQQWINQGGYAALNVGGIIRPFSFFTSSAEYAGYASTAAMLLIAALCMREKAWGIAIIPLLLLAVFLIGSRTPIVKMLFTGAVMWAMMGRSVASWAPRLALAGVIGVAGLVWTMTRVQQADFSPEVSPLVAHQTEGLLNPTGENSTAGIHGSMMFNGLFYPLQNPLGRGLGSTTLAASKFGGVGGSSEVDFSNIAISCGLVGGVIYLAIIFYISRAAVIEWVQRRTLVALATGTVLLLGVGGWLIGGQYSTVAFTWFMIGALDRRGMPTPPRKRRLGAA